MLELGRLRSNFSARFLTLTLGVSALGACSPSPEARGEGGDSGSVGGSLAASGASSTPPLTLGGRLNESGSGGTSGGLPVAIFTTLPDGFTKAQTEEGQAGPARGGYRVVGPLADVPPPNGECGNILRVIVRDFQTSHDDFEHASDWSAYEVASPIGAARKPEKTSANGPLHFEEWYQNLPDVNQPFAVDLWLEPVGDTFVFDSSLFLPLSGWGYEDNYLFTTELHTNFEYKGGEVFTFRGDDDVFVFVNGSLGVNLAGVHTAQEGAIDLDAKAADFGLAVGKSYTFDLFQAERQPSGSNFRLETTLSFTGCGVILPPDIIVK